MSFDFLGYIISRKQSILHVYKKEIAKDVIKIIHDRCGNSFNDIGNAGVTQIYPLTFCAFYC